MLRRAFETLDCCPKAFRQIIEAAHSLDVHLQLLQGADAQCVLLVTFLEGNFVEEPDMKLAGRCCYTAAGAGEEGSRLGPMEKAGKVEEEETIAVAGEQTQVTLVEVDNFDLEIELMTFDVARDI